MLSSPHAEPTGSTSPAAAARSSILDGLRRHGLLRGKNLGIDSSVIEANASWRALENRNTGEAYWDYVKRLAAEAGVEVEDPVAVRRFEPKAARPQDQQSA